MKKSFLLLCAAIFISGTHVTAQNFTLGVKAGISIPNLTAGGSNQNPINTGYSSRLGPEAGIFAEYKFSALFSLQAAIQYSSQGGKKNGMQALTTPDAFAAMFPPGQAPQYLYARYNSEAKLGYLMLPVLAKFSWQLSRSPFSIYVAAGPFVSTLLSAKQVTSGKSNLYMDASGQQPLPVESQSFDNTEDIKSQLHSFNFGIEGNVGLNYHFSQHNVFIEGGGNYGFLNIQKKGANGENNVGAAVVVVGYSYSLLHHKK
ncbi:MAG: PorT family protein [Bacteroidetes bacterium]|nr:PorT family protein [Bacteroidota bacterium]